jgi:hypothetical protein
MPECSSSNPFATRFTRPGALRFRWPAGDSLEACLERLRASGWWGEIIGPHGSGKSTLLAALVPALAAAGRNPIAFELHAGERRLPHWRDRLRSLDARSIVAIDGYEQLGRFERWRIRRICKARGSGLLVTTHTSLGLPTVMRTRVDAELAMSLTRALVDVDSPIAEQDVRDALAAHNGDLREAFFTLYDLYELRRQRS